MDLRKSYVNFSSHSITGSGQYHTPKTKVEVENDRHSRVRSENRRDSKSKEHIFSSSLTHELSMLIVCHYFITKVLYVFDNILFVSYQR